MSTPDFGRPRVTVLWHSDLRRDTSGHYLIKEVWGWYLEKALAPSAHKVTIVASLARSGDARFQEYMLTHPVFSVMPLTRDRTKTGLRRTFGNLRDVTAAVRDADVVWVFMPAWKGVYGAAVARLLRRPVVSYFGCEWVGMGDAGRMSNAFRGVGQRAVVALSERILVADEHQLSRYESQRPGRVLRRAPAMLVSPSEI